MDSMYDSLPRSLKTEVLVRTKVEADEEVLKKRQQVIESFHRKNYILLDVATTLSITTFTITTFSIATLGIMTYNIMTLSILTFSILINKMRQSA